MSKNSTRLLKGWGKDLNTWWPHLMDGHTDQELANICNKSIGTIYRWRKKFGVPSFQERINFEREDYLLLLTKGYYISDKYWDAENNYPIKRNEVLTRENFSVYWFRCDIDSAHRWRSTADPPSWQISTKSETTLPWECEIFHEGDTVIWNKGLRWRTAQFKLGTSKLILPDLIIGCPYCRGLEPLGDEEYIQLRAFPNHRGMEEFDRNTPPRVELNKGNRKSYSKKSIQLWDKISMERGIEIFHAENGGEVSIPCTEGFRAIRVDGYSPSTNTVFQFHGDIWHGNPTIYSGTDFPHPFKPTIPANILYLQTINRDNELKVLGFDVEVYWETEIED